MEDGAADGAAVAGGAVGGARSVAVSPGAAVGARGDWWRDLIEDARQRCMAVGTDCTVVVDWSCDSQHGNNGWRYCRSQPTSGTTNACERQVVHSAACGAPTIAPTQAPSTVHVRGDWAQCWDAAGTIGAGNTAWHGTREDARQRCMAVGTDCTVVVDWSCDSQHGNNGWRYCRSQPTSGTTNACERQVVHSAACGAPTIAPTQAPST
eukprot:gene17643-55096_t